MTAGAARHPRARRAPVRAGAGRGRFEASLAFTLDDFQHRALDAVDAGDSVLVAAPTGSGKTVVAEYAVASALAASRKAFYTTPIKALSNQKFHDLRAQHGPGRVGLLTGDNAVNPDASVVVMTTEVLRNMIYEGSTALDNLGVVVLDEVHYLQDPYRGAVWEEVIVHLDPGVQLVCLSATVSNAEEFGDWLRTVRGGTEVVIEERRPVELRHLYGVALRDAEEMMLLPTFVEERVQRLPQRGPSPAQGVVPNPKGADFDAGTARWRGGRPPRGQQARGRPVTPRRVELVQELAHREMLPAIYFLFSRAGCDDAVEQLMAARVRLGHGDSAVAVREIAERRCDGLSDDDLAALGYGPWLAALEAGIAAHHAGMVPPMKEAVEEAFLEGLVRVVFATETLALGVNMPARSVVIERLTKFTGERHEFLTPGEYTQLTGRAGRRGIDDLGYGIVLWNRFARFDQVAALASRRTYELTSSFRPTYNMAVNLVRRYEREEAHHLLNLSFAQYRVDREVVALERRADDAFRRLERARERASCERGDVGEYRGLLDRLERARRAQADGGQAAAVARLRPGDVVHAGRGIGRVVVVRRATGRGGNPRVTALDERGRPVRLSAGSFRGPPAVMGRIELPEPFRPNNPGFRREVGLRLRRSDAKPVRPADGRRGALTKLERQVASHPVAGCPDLGRHLDAARRVERLQAELHRGRSGAETRSETLSRRFERVLGVLSDRGYVEDWGLTPAGELLSRIYSECDLLVAEAVRDGVLADLTAPEAAAVVSLFTYTARGPDEPPSPRWPTASVARRAHRAEDLWRALRADEASAGLPESRPPDGGFALVAHEWASGRALDDVLGDEELTGGDFVRQVKQVIDLLRQLGDALTASSPQSARTARAAADALFRGVVEASSRVEA